MIDKISVADFRRMIIAASDTINSRSEEFSRLDATLGDGDHGEAMSSALNVMKSECQKNHEFKTMFNDIGFGIMLQTSGSTSTLLGGFVLGMGDSVSSGATEINTNELKQLFKGALEGVMKNTKAKQGDKTIIDSLMPAVEAMQSCDSYDCKEVLKKGAEAALKGAENTKEMRANFGRARNLGDKTIGHIDAGALSWATMIDAMYRAL